VAGCCGDEAWVTQKMNLMYVALTRARERLVLCDKVAAWLKPLGLELESAAEGQSEQKRRRTTVSVFGQVNDIGDGKGEGSIAGFRPRFRRSAIVPETRARTLSSCGGVDENVALQSIMPKILNEAGHRAPF